VKTDTLTRTPVAPAPDTARSGARRTAILVTAAIVLQVLFALSYLWVSQGTSPHRLKIAVAAPSASAADDLVRRIGGPASQSLDPVLMVDGARAVQAVRNRSVQAAFIAGSGTADELVVASSAGQAQSVLLATRFQTFEKSQKRTLTVRDAVPLPREDRRGVASSYLTLAAMLGGLLGAFLPVRAGRRSGLRRLGIFAAYAVLSATAVVLGSRAVLGAVRGHEVQAVASLALVCFATIAVVTLLHELFGRLGPVVGVALFVAVGSPATGEAVATAFQPAPYRLVSGYLIDGAGADLLRNLTYFEGHATTRPLVVLLAWALVGVAGTAVVTGRTGSLPWRR